MTVPQDEMTVSADHRAAYYRDQYEYLVRHMPNAMFVIDPAKDRIVEANDAACHLLGYTRDQLVGSMKISDIHPREMDLLRGFGKQVLEHGFAQTEKLTCLTAANRNIPVIMHGSVHEDVSGRPLIRAIVIDNLDPQVMAQALRDEVTETHNYEEISGTSAGLRSVLAQVQRVAPTDSTALILGETGTGKELICRAIHHASLRHNRPLVKLNCAAIPSGLIESELFGHEKGAFTGAVAQKRGRFELAHKGTIFLDEIGDIPLETQPKLLRLLQEQEFERVGGTATIEVDVRVIAATHRDLAGMVRAGDFREDLFYRLNVFPLTLPPLRERREDIQVLSRYFAQRKSARLGRPSCTFTAAAMQRLSEYSWPGNIRELENIIERAVILCDGDTIDFPHVQVDMPGPRHGADAKNGTIRTLQEMEREHVIAALRAAGGKVSGKGGAAELLGLKPSTLESRMKKLSIGRGDA